jgi:hypothetical protein
MKELKRCMLVIAVEKQICNALSLSSLVDTFALKPRKLYDVLSGSKWTYHIYDSYSCITFKNINTIQITML